MNLRRFIQRVEGQGVKAVLFIYHNGRLYSTFLLCNYEFVATSKVWLFL